MNSTIQKDHLTDQSTEPTTNLTKPHVMNISKQPHACRSSSYQAIHDHQSDVLHKIPLSTFALWKDRNESLESKNQRYHCDNLNHHNTFKNFNLA